MIVCPGCAGVGGDHSADLVILRPNVLTGSSEEEYLPTLRTSLYTKIQSNLRYKDSVSLDAHLGQSDGLFSSCLGCSSWTGTGYLRPGGCWCQMFSPEPVQDSDPDWTPPTLLLLPHSLCTPVAVTVTQITIKDSL